MAVCAVLRLELRNTAVICAIEYVWDTLRRMSHSNYSRNFIYTCNKNNIKFRLNC